MSGGSHTPRQVARDASLRERVATGADPVGPDDPRPCWVRLGDAPVAGHVVAWTTDGAGGWQAVCLVVLPAGAVSPRHGDASS